MKTALRTLGLAGLLAVGTSAFASTAPDDGNPYLELYRLRVLQAEQNVERQRALAELADKRLARGRRLIASHAISTEEYEVLTSESLVTHADRTLATRKVDESKAFLRIVEALVKRGIAIPLCTYETE